VRRHVPDAGRAANAVTGRRELADDAVQDALEHALRSIGRVDADRSFGAWLNRIVVNCSLDILKKTARLRPLRS
jgi:DNA-directed RNA polymerase specialized sigma24 family protein